MVRRVTWIMLLLLITACAVRDTSNMLDLSEDALKHNHSDIEKLYSVWIKPVSKVDAYGFHKVQLRSTQEWYDAQNSLREGMSRFCALQQGVFTEESNQRHTGFHLICRDSKGGMIGKLMVQLLEDDILQVEFDSLKRVMQREKVKIKFLAMKKLNGPTGKLITKNGEEIEFIRIGNFYEPDLWFVEKGDNKVLFSSIQKLAFRDEKKSPVVDVTLPSGVQFTVNEARLGYQSSPFSYVMGGDVLIVVIDNKTKQPYTKIYNWFNGISEIVFDDKNIWKDKRAARISSHFQLVTKEKYQKYVDGITQRATALYALLRVNAADYFQDGKVTRNYAEYAYRELIFMQNRRMCSQTIDKGIEDIEIPLQCQQAKMEVKALDNYGLIHKYPLNVKESPLTSLIILRKIQYDMKGGGIN